VIVFRRVAADLREIRWGHVLVELVLVIAGILIALAVNDWMEGRKDARAERQYLELLARDLDNDMKVLAEARDFQDKQAADAAAAYAALAAPVPPEARDALAERLDHLSTRFTLRFNRTTYTDLTGTGNVRLIHNRTLRDRLAKYYENTERTAAISQRNNQFFVDENFARYVSDTGLIAPRPSDNVALLDASGRAFEARTGMTVTTANDRLWTLPAGAPEWTILRNKVWQRGLTAQVDGQRLAGLGEELAAARKAVGDELARRRWPGD
jgi:hypothetical protein